GPRTVWAAPFSRPTRFRAAHELAVSLMDGRDFLKVAEDLAVGDSEAEWRSAISRAYYGAFHVARTLLLQGGFDAPVGDQAHAYLWLRLSNCGHPDVAEAGR